MTAEEQFKKLGYKKKCYGCELILYIKKQPSSFNQKMHTDYLVEFNFRERSVDMWAVEVEGIDKTRNIEFHIDDMKLFEAIQKQLKELEW